MTDPVAGHRRVLSESLQRRAEEAKNVIRSQSYDVLSPRHVRVITSGSAPAAGTPFLGSSEKSSTSLLPPLGESEKKPKRNLRPLSSGSDPTSNGAPPLPPWPGPAVSLPKPNMIERDIAAKRKRREGKEGSSEAVTDQVNYKTFDDEEKKIQSCWEKYGCCLTGSIVDSKRTQ